LESEKKTYDLKERFAESHGPKFLERGIFQLGGFREMNVAKSRKNEKMSDEKIFKKVWIYVPTKKKKNLDFSKSQNSKNEKMKK
jgi:hypothetical protein